MKLQEEQKLIQKHIFEELSFSEIAKLYNKSKQAIQQMFKRILNKLKYYLYNIGGIYAI